MRRYLVFAVALSFILDSGFARAADKPPDEKTVVPAVLCTPQSALDAALADAKDLATKGLDPAYYRWSSSYHGTTEKRRRFWEELANLAANSLNFKGRLPAPAERVDKDGYLLRFDLKALHIDPKVWDKLLSEGSGVGKFPEPYFHAEVTKAPLVKRTRKVKKVWPGGADKDGHYFPKGYEYEITEEYEEFDEKAAKATRTHGLGLDQDKAILLAKIVGSDYALCRTDWLAYYALQPPFYIEAQGRPKSQKDLEKLAGLVRSGKGGTKLRGAVLFSEVARANRITEREPLDTNYGRGSWHSTFDFFKSIRRSNVLKDVLVDEADAGEIFWTLPNGLWGWALVNAKRDVIDFADPRVATNNRTYLHLKAIEQGYTCIICHTNGPLLVADEVRLSGRDTLALLDTKIKDKARQEEIADQYFGEEYNRLLLEDQRHYDATVRALTGRAAAAVSADWELLLYQYGERPITPEDVAIETGYPLAVVMEVIDSVSKTGGIDHTFARMLKGRKARRDQFEEAFQGLMAYLVKVPVEKLK